MLRQSSRTLCMSVSDVTLVVRTDSMGGRDVLDIRQVGVRKFCPTLDSFFERMDSFFEMLAFVSIIIDCLMNSYSLGKECNIKTFILSNKFLIIL